MAFNDSSRTQTPTISLKGSVLVVEDNPVNQKVASAMLQRMGLDVTLVENGALGVESYKQGGYDLILMDIQMPVMDGLEATRKIREHEQQNDLRPIRIVALTANSQPQDRQACMDAGMDEYLAKPVRRMDLQDVVSRYLQDE